MHSIMRGFMIILLAINIAACNRTIKPEELPATMQLGHDYYTRFVIRYEKGKHRTTNYRRGLSIPVNTRVTLLEVTQKTIRVELPSHQELLIENASKYSGDDIYQAFDKLFAAKRVDLSRFTKLERQHIKSGTVAKGMRKKAVLVAIGYPPKHQTPSLDMEQWTYWSSRFNRFVVHFNNGKVYRIQQ